MPEITTKTKLPKGVESFDDLEVKDQKALIASEFNIEALSIDDLPIKLAEGEAPVVYFSEDSVTFWENKKRKIKVRRVTTVEYLGTNRKYLVLAGSPENDHSMIVNGKVGTNVIDSAPHIDLQDGWAEITPKKFYS